MLKEKKMTEEGNWAKEPFMRLDEKGNVLERAVEATQGTCKDCKWWDAENEEGNNGSCVRFPPFCLWSQLLILAAIRNPKDYIEPGTIIFDDETHEKLGTSPLADVGLWPVTNSHNWCGEFEEKAPAAPERG